MAVFLGFMCLFKPSLYYKSKSVRRRPLSHSITLYGKKNGYEAHLHEKSSRNRLHLT